jgi:hypothetical protein
MLKKNDHWYDAAVEMQCNIKVAMNSCDTVAVVMGFTVMESATVLSPNP